MTKTALTTHADSFEDENALAHEMAINARPVPRISIQAFSES